MKNISYFRTQALNLNQQQFELAFADVIEVFDTHETKLTTEDGKTIILHWYPNGVYQIDFVVEEPTTAQMAESSYVKERINQAIGILKNLTWKGDCVDGETMQYVLKEVGMEDQMLRQLIMSQPIEEVRYMIEEREEFEEELDNQI
jgi:hypothetical protein